MRLAAAVTSSAVLTATIAATVVRHAVGSVVSGGAAESVETVSAAAVTRPSGQARIVVPLARGDGGEGSGGMVIVGLSGRRIATLTRPHPGWEDSGPAWSPDGRWLAFTRTTDGRRSFQIYVMRANGSGVRRITHGRFDTDPAWSPNGRWLAYRSNRELRVVHPDGSGGRAVPIRRPAEIDYPAWVPGGRIAYSYHLEVPSDWPPACRPPGSGCGYVISSRLDGTQRRLVVRGRDAHWSPDGRTVLYTGPDGGVYTATASGRKARMLSRGYLAEWSPNGRQIVYSRMGDRPSQDSVWIMNRDGSNAHRILAGGADPSWQP